MKERRHPDSKCTNICASLGWLWFNDRGKEKSQGRISTSSLCFPLIILSLTRELTCPYPHSRQREGRGRGGERGRPVASQKWMCGEAEPAGLLHINTQKMSVLAVNRPLTSPPRQRGRLNTDAITAAAHDDLQNKVQHNRATRGCWHLPHSGSFCRDFSSAR